MKKLLSLLFILSILTVNAQFSLTGKIVNSNGKPLAYAKVVLLKASKGAITNENGEYKINNINTGTYTISARLFGFNTYTKTIKIDSDLKINISLLEDENAKEFEEVVVSGTMKTVSKTESPVAVEVYSANFFRANPTPSLFESLQNVNGVRPQLNCNVCNTGDIHINGLEGPYTMILIDGMPIVSGLSTVYGLSGIPQALIERIEIVKGPASTLYGSEAVGGLINVITKSPLNAPSTYAQVMTTSWLETNVDIGKKYHLGKKIDGLLGLNYFNFNTPIDNNGDNFTDVTLSKRISVFNKINISRKNNKTFNLAGRYIYEDRWGGEMNWNRNFRGGDSIYGESIYTNRWEVFGKYQIPTKEEINLQFSGNGHNQNSVYGNTVFKADQYIGFGQLTWNKTLFNKNMLLVGAGMRYTYYDDDSPATEKEIDKHTYLPGVFVQDDIKLNKQNRILLGLRYDYNSNYGNIFSPRANYKWMSKNKQNILRIGTGNGYRVVNVFTEDHAALTGAREVVFKEDLKPEQSYNANINFVKKIYTKKQAIIELDATAFYTHFQNRVLADYDEDPNKIIYKNIKGSSVSRGFTGSIDMYFKSSLRIRTGITLQDVFYELNGHKENQILTEKISGTWSVSYTIPKVKIKLNYTGNLYGPMRLPLISDLDNRDEFSPYWSIQNIQLSKTFKNGLELFGGLKNLLNFTPPANSIARANDPFDKQVSFDADGNALSTPNNPNALTFDPSYVYAPNQGIRGFFGFRMTIK